MADDPNAALMAQVKALEEANAALVALNAEDFAMTDTLPTKDAAALLGCAAATLARHARQFRLVQDKVAGRIQWRADVIRTAAGMRGLSVERRIEAAIRQVEG